jgi:hypothetical protein
MTNQPNILRSLIIYGICLPLAVLIGYMLTSSEETVYYLSTGQLTSAVVIFGIILAVLITPVLLRFHHLLLICCWNMTAVFFFLPGRPAVWMGFTAISFLISIGHRTLEKDFRFISVPEVTRPLVFLAIVVFVTAEATGGVGLRAFGGDLFGGKRYFMLFGAIVAYFAITALKISPKQAGFVTAIFFLGGLTNLIGDFANSGLGILQPLVLIFPPGGLTGESDQMQGIRYLGLSAFSSAFFAFLMSRFGVFGIFSAFKPWRWILFVSVCFAGMFGGFRSYFIALAFTFTVQFWIEGAHRTKLLPLFLFIFVTCAAIAYPFLDKLPSSVQRTVSFLPLPIDPIVRMDAQGSSDWRLRMWKAVLPLVPDYLLMGKGYGLSAQDFVFSQDFRQQMQDEDWRTAATAGDYHNGPLSVIITFGIWGVIAFVWFIAAALRVLHHNYRYGDPKLRTVNAFLFAVFAARVFIFVFIVGGLQSDMEAFIGWIGLSVSLNGGMAKPAPETEREMIVQSPALTSTMSRPRPAFGRTMRIG